jgi:tetratricopeptide (TPR) repeat protein
MSKDKNNSPATPAPIPPGQGQPAQEVFDLADLDELPLAEPEEPFPRSGSGLAPIEPPFDPLPGPSNTVSFDLPNASDDEPGGLTMGVSLDDLPELDEIPVAGVEPLPELPPRQEVETENYEPLIPVAPASGWLDSEAPVKPVDTDLFAEPLGVHEADLFEAPPAIESSDIFSAGPIPTAAGADQSDVISATAYGPSNLAQPHKLSSPSDADLSLDSIQEGSSLWQQGEVLGAEQLPGSSDDVHGDALRDFTPVHHDPDADPDDISDYGATPQATQDASSILSDLSDPGDISFNESSAVRLDAPGVGRTLSNNPEQASEFDLTVSKDPAVPELDAAASAAEHDETTDWQDQGSSDLFAEGRSVGEINLGFESGLVSPIDPHLTSEDPSLTSAPSSIFSGAKPPFSSPGSDHVRIGRPAEEEDAAVEFSDHPTAAPESDNSALPGLEKTSVRPLQPSGKIDFDHSNLPTPPAQDSQDSGRVDWGNPELAAKGGGEAGVGLPNGIQDSPASGILKLSKFEEESFEESTRPPNPKVKSATGKTTAGFETQAAPALPDGSDPSVEIDWMAGSSSEEPVLAPEVYEQAAPTKDKTKSKAKDKKVTDREKKRLNASREVSKALGKKTTGSWIGGTLLGMVLASGACAGLYFGGVIPKGDKSEPIKISQAGTTTPPTQQIQPTEKPSLGLGDAKAALEAGDPTRALKVLDTITAAAPDKVTPDTKAARGQARLFATYQGLGEAATVASDNVELKKAREELQAVLNDAEAGKTPGGEKLAVKATIHLGLTYELAGDQAKAREIYEEGLRKFPNYSATFQAALDRVTALTATSDGLSRRLLPADAQQLLFAVLLIQPETSTKEEEEAGMSFWRAVNLATAGRYSEATAEIKKAKQVHLKQAKAQAGRGLNPLSDPLEQIFSRCCDELKAYWELRGAISANKPIAELVKKDGVEKAMSELAAAQSKALEAVKLMTDLKEATDKLAKADKDLKAAADKLAVEEKTRLTNEAQIGKELVEARESYAKAEATRVKAEETIASLAKELQTAKLLPEKYDLPALLAAQKSATDRATGPTLTALLSPGMMTVGGAGLSAGQLVDLAERLTKAEATAKIATEKLAVETKRLTTENAAELRTLKEGHAAAVKKLTDEYAAEMKKLMDTYATSSAKVKEDHLAELKTMTDKFATDLKKLTDENAMAIKTLTDGFEGKIKGLEAAVAKEKAAGEDVAARLRLDFGNALSPAKALDLWLPQLTELRRVADADPALANAKKVLSTAGADSEDAAKARTVAGLALLLKGNLAEAKELFQAARSSPAYLASAGKEWVKAADLGLASVTDPLAPYRLPIEKPRRDLKLAARALDLGIGAYKSGRYAESVTFLTDSTKADPTNPLAWYFLGAAHWGTGAISQAKEDFRQGGEWEKQSTLLGRAISDSLESIQGPARDALSVARP